MPIPKTIEGLEYQIKKTMRELAQLEDVINTLEKAGGKYEEKGMLYAASIIAGLVKQLETAYNLKQGKLENLAKKLKQLQKQQ